jgi:hypothetical protein
MTSVPARRIHRQIGRARSAIEGVVATRRLRPLQRARRHVDVGAGHGLGPVHVVDAVAAADQGVGAVDKEVVVAVSPRQAVSPDIAEQHIVAVAAYRRIIPGPKPQEVIEGAAGHGIVAADANTSTLAVCVAALMVSLPKPADIHSMLVAQDQCSTGWH